MGGLIALAAVTGDGIFYPLGNVATNQRAVRSRTSKRRASLWWLLGTLVTCTVLFSEGTCMADKPVYPLPEPRLEGGAPLIEALRQRRTSRSFAPRGLALPEIAQLLWAAQGITSPDGFRTAPSAGALYPLELHLLAGDVEGLPAGSYRYDARHHSLTAERTGDLGAALARAALGQNWIAQAPAAVVICAIESRTKAKYGRRGERYVHIEAGHAGQNLLLQAIALDLASATVGAFNDGHVADLLELPHGERPLLILPVGRRP